MQITGSQQAQQHARLQAERHAAQQEALHQDHHIAEAPVAARQATGATPRHQPHAHQATTAAEQAEASEAAAEEGSAAAVEADQAAAEAHQEAEDNNI